MVRAVSDELVFLYTGMRSRAYTHTFFHSLSLSVTHTHTHTHAHTHTVSHTHKHTLVHTHTDTKTNVSRFFNFFFTSFFFVFFSVISLWGVKMTSSCILTSYSWLLHIVHAQPSHHSLVYLLHGLWQQQLKRACCGTGVFVIQRIRHFVSSSLPETRRPCNFHRSARRVWHEHYCTVAQSIVFLQMFPSNVKNQRTSWWTDCFILESKSQSEPSNGLSYWRLFMTHEYHAE